MNNITTKNIDSIFKTRVSKNTNIYKIQKDIYTNDNSYHVKNIFELNDDTLIYNKKPLITYYNKADKQKNIDELIKKQIILKEKNNSKPITNNENPCNSCFSSIV
jgi:hypothetical protein